MSCYTMLKKERGWIYLKLKGKYEFYEMIFSTKVFVFWFV